MVLIYIACGLCAFFLIFHTLTKKYLNPYKLYLVFGKKGSGKSTYLAKLACKYLNFTPSNSSKPKRVKTRKFPTEKRLHPNTKQWIVYTNMTDLNLPGIRHIDIDQLGDFVPVANSVLLLDEVGMVWDNRNFKQFRPSVRDFFKLQRHYKVIVYMASQSYDVDKKLRDLTDGMFLCKNFARVFTIAKPIYRSVVLTKSTSEAESRISEDLRFLPFWNWKWTLIPKYAQYFDSHTVPELPELPYREQTLDDIDHK